MIFPQQILIELREGSIALPDGSSLARVRFELRLPGQNMLLCVDNPEDALKIVGSFFALAKAELEKGAK